MCNKLVSLFVVIGLTASVAVKAGEVKEVTPDDLVNQYHKLEKSSSPLAVALPIYLKTVQKENVLNVSLLGTIPFKFSDVAAVLAKPGSYCDFLPLMFNVKGCVITDFNPVTRIKFYVAGKHYTSPITSYRIHAVFRLVGRTPDKIRVRLEADPDTPGKSDYDVDLMAIPLDGETLMYLESRFAPGRITRMATNTYVNVFARDKPGFTEIQEPGGKKKLITGFPAVIERSSVRAYFALKAYMLNHHLPPAKRFDACLNTWYDLNQPYKKQLYELERDQYLQIKRREHKNQLRIQKKVRQSAKVKVGTLE
ncbi:MAG: hypothetical protein ACWGOV_05020 [Acidiferrobacterales bacterium]